MLFNSTRQIAKPLQCPDCNIEMEFLVSRPTRPVFVSTILERRFFLCVNCQRLSHRLVAMPVDHGSSAAYHPADSKTLAASSKIVNPSCSDCGPDTASPAPHTSRREDGPHSESRSLCASQTQ